jgi:hypothetical protein
MKKRTTLPIPTSSVTGDTTAIVLSSGTVNAGIAVRSGIAVRAGVLVGVVHPGEVF